MLRAAPWRRLPLTVRWLKQEYRMDFAPELQPPLHIPLTFGCVRAKRKPQQECKEQEERRMEWCALCGELVKVGDTQVLLKSVMISIPLACLFLWFQAADRLSCFHPSCQMVCHLICLAQHFLKSDPSHLLPVEGECPGCSHSVLWGSLIRHKNGCYGDLEEITSSSSQVCDVFA